MRISCLVALFILVLSWGAHATERKKILFTTFDPFGGSKENNSQAIGALLRAHPNWIGSQVEVVVCNLPVVYGRAPQQALACIEKEKPYMVVSLGEAACKLRLESSANNLDDSPGFPDNAGNIRRVQAIIPGASARLGFAFPVEAMICAVDPAGKAGIEASVTPGNFVCNHLAFSLTHTLAGQKIPFTFIHVPNSKCKAKEKSAKKNARRIALAVGAALRALSDSPPSEAEAIWRPKGRMPSSPEEISPVIAKLGKTPACQISYAKRLSGAWQARVKQDQVK